MKLLLLHARYNEPRRTCAQCQGQSNPPPPKQKKNTKQKKEQTSPAQENQAATPEIGVRLIASN